MLDTSPLQALWRAGILDQLRHLFETTSVPKSVADETRWSLHLVGPERVPDLAAHPWILNTSVPAEAVFAAMTLLYEENHRRQRGRKPHPQPHVEVVGDEVVASTGPVPLVRVRYKIPDLEVALLAKQVGGVAIMDDRKALRAASDLGVKSATTREVVRVMVREGLIEDEKAVIDRMRTTGYHPTHRVTNSWDGKP